MVLKINVLQFEQQSLRHSVANFPQNFSAKVFT
jgi:hypothetical protein